MSLHHTEDAFELEDKRLTAAVPSMTTPASSDSNSNHDVDLEGKLPAAQHLRPTDGGVAAWRLLLAAFVFEALLWGKHRVASTTYLPTWTGLCFYLVH